MDNKEIDYRKTKPSMYLTDKKEIKKNLLKALPLIIAVVMVMIIIVLANFKYIRANVTVEATIVDFGSERYVSDDYDEIRKYAIYEYKYNGHTYQSSLNYKTGWKYVDDEEVDKLLGTTQKIKLNPNNPTEIYLTKRIYFLDLILILGAVGFILFIIEMARLNPKYNYIDIKDLKNKKINTNTKVNEYIYTYPVMHTKKNYIKLLDHNEKELISLNSKQIKEEQKYFKAYENNPTKIDYKGQKKDVPIRKVVVYHNLCCRIDFFKSTNFEFPDIYIHSLEDDKLVFEVIEGHMMKNKIVFKTNCTDYMFLTLIINYLINEKIRDNLSAV